MSSIKKYNLIRQIGEGGFGTVSIGQEIGRYKKFFAIKVQKIERIMRNRGADDRAAAEVKILQRAIGKNFLSQIYESFLDMEHFYIVMDLEIGGDLHSFIHGSYYKPNEEILKFIAVNIICGLNQLAQIGVIHNDLKPENILIGSNGYLRISDFGLSSIGTSDYGKKGTEFYIAPECYKLKPYKNSADWFSFGVILYEVSEKSHPFHSEQNLRYSEPVAALKLGDAVWKFIQGLLQKDPALGMCSMAQAKATKYFEDVDFGAIEAQTKTSPLCKFVKNHPVMTKFESIAFFKRDSSKKVENFKDVACQAIEESRTIGCQAIEESRTIGCQAVEECRAIGCQTVTKCISIGCQTSPVVIIQVGAVTTNSTNVEIINEEPEVAQDEMAHSGYGGVEKPTINLSTKHYYNDYINVDGKFVCNISGCGCKKSFKATKTFKQHARDFVCKTLEMFKCGLCGEVFPREVQLKDHAKSHANTSK